MIEPTLDWEHVASEAKEIADAHGWNDPPEDDATHTVNVLCELFEAWQLYRAGHEVDEPITCEGAGLPPDARGGRGAGGRGLRGCRCSDCRRRGWRGVHHAGHCVWHV